MSTVTLRDRRRRATSAVMLALTGVAAVLTVVPLVLIFGYLLREGASSLDLSFFIHTPRPTGEAGGGMGNAIVGTLEMVGLAALIGLPVAVLAGVYLAEAEGSRLATVVRFTADVLNGVPSIAVGIFVYLLIVVPTGGFSALAGSVALATMLVPMVTRTTEEMVRLVPRELTEGGLALGMPRWRTMLGVVLPAARGGILTGALVGVARIAGETAPLLFTALGNQFWQLDPRHPTAALPLQIFSYAISPYEDWHRQAWAGALVLILLVLGLSLGARLVLGRAHKNA
ncbi:phosphate ABC transporter permease PstA [Longimicrobium sp.]|uniref:phosphate ABC transporter permease PstA n=1 Tax=Longimicrobium sp. TaxID=2029185 RepID=UPI002B9D33A4|nr:phosphate ABC transporter permease PstA [Longimicrobium sp.]HSU13251.1 phosphate ABC transporter permease PstA [Longimicrobium sp.]